MIIPQNVVPCSLLLCYIALFILLLCFSDAICAACTLHYQDINTTASLPAGVQLKVCNDLWSNFTELNKVAQITDSDQFRGKNLKIPVAEAVVLQRIRTHMLNASEGSDITDMNWINCMHDQGDVTVLELSKFKFEWGVYCSNRMQRRVSGIYIGFLPLASSVSEWEKDLPELTEELGNMLLNLKQLNSVQFLVYGGNLPPQFGALDKLQTLIINHYCLHGSLPSQWINGMRSLEVLKVVPPDAAVNYADPDGGTCGVQGTVPKAWFTNLAHAPKIYYTDLSYNNLEGVL